MNIPDNDLNHLKHIAKQIRKDIVGMVNEAKSGHIGGALGLADIFTVLYHYHAHVNPGDENNDIIIQSNGHTCPVLYAALASKGFFPKDELLKFRKIDSLLQGHPHYPHTPGVEHSGGPLGQGTSLAVGCAIGTTLRNQTKDIYCIIGDGESQEGQVWEAIMCAATYKCNNLTFIMDANNIQIDGPVNKVSSILYKVKEKFDAFGWHAIEINGNDFHEIKSALDEARNYKEGPVAIIARTTPGKGVDFMENNYAWHGRAPKPDEFESAMRQLQ